MIADDERRELQQVEVGRDTSDLVIEIANVLNDEEDYDKAMNGALDLMGHAIHPERLYVFERGETTTDNTFEWCAEGVEPMIDSLQDVDNSEFDTWEKLMADEGMKMSPNQKIFIGKPINFDPDVFMGQLKDLLDAAYREQQDTIRELVAETVTTYQYNKKA
jgi:hypothetical protein